MIESAPASTNRKDHTLIQGTLRSEVLLSPSVKHVRVGTPLVPSVEGGWVPAPSGWGEMVAGEAKYGGEYCTVYRQAVLKVTNQKLPKGRLGVGDLDDSGFLIFKADPEGPFTRLTVSQVLLDMTYAATVARMVEIMLLRETK